MKKLLMMAVLLGTSASALTADIYSPASGDDEGISMGLTSKYLGEQAYSKLDKTLGNGTAINLGEYTLSNGVHCDSEAKQRYKDRFYPRTPDKKEKTLTQQIFGKANKGK